MVLAASTDGYLYAVDIKNGRIIWKYDMDGRISSSPIAVGKYVISASESGKVAVIDTSIGVDKWRANLDEAIHGSPAFFNGWLYLTATNCSVYAYKGGL